MEDAVKSTTGFPVIEAEGEYHVVQIRNGKFKRIHKPFSFCNLATPEQNEQGLFGLVEYHSGTLEQCRAAAVHASFFGEAFIVERRRDKVAVAEFENGVEVPLGATRFAR